MCSNIDADAGSSEPAGQLTIVSRSSAFRPATGRLQRAETELYLAESPARSVVKVAGSTRTPGFNEGRKGVPRLGYESARPLVASCSLFAKLGWTRSWVNKYKIKTLNQ